MPEGTTSLPEIDFAIDRLPDLHEVLADLRDREPVSRILFAGRSIWLANDYETVSRHIASDEVLSAPAAYEPLSLTTVGRVLPTMSGTQHRLNRAVVSRVFFPGRMREYAEVLFAEEGLPDSIWFFEDMGFKGKPFMSPAMYREIMFPGHKRLFDYAHSLGRRVLVHSCGFVEPLVPGLVEAGMDCLQAMEVKAGMDMPRLFERFGMATVPVLHSGEVLGVVGYREIVLAERPGER